MSTPSALASEVRPYHGRIIRIVEGQHLISTNRLAGDAADQALLEALADDVKPQLPEAAQRLPWLLASPFRYGLGRPSRFRAADVLPGIFYAAEDVETAVAETAHWRLVAFSRSPGFLRPKTPTPMSAFSVMVNTESALDLSVGKLGGDADRWTHPTDYSGTQQLAADARMVGVTAIRAPSGRLQRYQQHSPPWSAGATAVPQDRHHLQQAKGASRAPWRRICRRNLAAS